MIGLAVVAVSSAMAQHKPVALAWDAPEWYPTNDPAFGYRVWVGTNSMTSRPATHAWNGTVYTNTFPAGCPYQTNWWLGNTQRCRMTNLAFPARYYVAVTVGASTGESAFSNELRVDVGQPGPQQLRVTADFQAALDVRGPWETVSSMSYTTTVAQAGFYRAKMRIGE